MPFVTFRVVDVVRVWMWMGFFSRTVRQNWEKNAGKNCWEKKVRQNWQNLWRPFDGLLKIFEEPLKHLLVTFGNLWDNFGEFEGISKFRRGTYRFKSCEKQELAAKSERRRSLSSIILRKENENLRKEL